jgi:hypothetical protein
MQTFYQPDAIAGDASHCCPICSRSMPACARYPAYVCGRCADKAVDGDGRPLVYVDAGGIGGISVEGASESGARTCFIGGIPCVVGEAKFGGFVMQVRDALSPIETDFKALSVQELLATHSAVLAELQARNIVRTGNNPTGDYVEWLVADRLGLKLEANSATGFDACCADGMRYQIKGRRLASAKAPAQLGVIRNLQACHFDFLIAVVMHADWSVAYAAKIPHSALESVAKFRAHVNGHVLRMTSAIFKVDGVEDLSAILR